MKTDFERIAANPLRGDKVANRRSNTDYKTRTVTDRNLGGDVFWRCGRYPEMSCTIERWREFCGPGARVLAISPKHLHPKGVVR